MNWIRLAADDPKRPDPIPGGMGAALKPADVDPKELKMGIDVEMEHCRRGPQTPDEKHDIAQDIALDHLSEIPDYYTRLKRMEDEAKKQAEPAK